MPEQRLMAIFGSEKAEPAPSMEERREVLFDRVEKELRKGEKMDRINIAARVFEHSTEDGIRLADRLLFTPEELQAAVLSPGFLLKHPRVIDRLINERSKSSGGTSCEKEFVSVVNVLDRLRSQNKKNGTAHLTETGLSQAQFQQKMAEQQKVPYYKDIDRFYIDLIRTSAPIEVSQKRKAEGALPTRSRGERMAENYLADIADVLERRYYTGPIKEMFKGYGEQPIFRQPTVTEDDLREFLVKHHYTEPDKFIRVHFKNAQVVVYRQLDAMKKGTVAADLLKEAKAELPEGWTVNLDREKNRYVIEELKVESRKSVKPETESKKEQIAAFEVRELEKKERLLKEGADKDVIASILAGFDSSQAWAMRERLLKEGADKGRVALGLSVLDSSQAWAMRERLLKEGADKGMVASSLEGLDSSQAWAMRERLLKEGASKGWVASGLSGLDSSQAWAMRERLLKEGADKSMVAHGLKWLDSSQAWAMRERLMKEGASTKSVDLGIGNYYKYFVWRLHKADEKIDLLNLVQNPDFKQIKEFLSSRAPDEGLQKQLERERMERSSLFARIMADTSKMDVEEARAFLRTNPAVPDRAPDFLAELLINRMLPYRTAANTTSMWEGFRGLFGGKGDGALRGNPETAFLDNPSWEMMGGGAESLSDKRKVLESREPMDALLVTGIYGRYSKEAKCWEKTFFSVHRELTPPTKETTLTLTSAKPGSRILLPLPTDARLIPERIRAVTKGGKEIPMQATVNSLGEATTEIPKGAVKVLYSIERELAFQPMEDVDKKEYATFKKRFERDYGTDLSASLARLPQDMQTELRSKAFQDLSLKEKVIRIEEMVRSLGYYDISNDEVSRQKLGKTVEEQIMMSEMRLTGLRNKSEDPSKFKGKRFAGVCADYAQIVCAALREAGISAGILSGFSMHGKEAQMRNSHATAFVPWPTADGGIRVIPIDGTPSDGAESLADAIGLSRPALSELEKQTETVVSEHLKESQEVIDQLLKDIGAGDVEAISKLSNGVLERALNLILSHDVKRSNVRAVTRMLEAYWYGPINKLEGKRRDIEMQEALEDEITRERKETPSADELANAGTELMKVVREFLTKFEKAGKDTQQVQITNKQYPIINNKGLDLLERITGLAKKELSQTEQRAMTAVIGYLRAKKMR